VTLKGSTCLIGVTPKRLIP